jgi:cation:H+ antiporter
VGTAMPETMIPLIAILFVGSASHEDIGIGAILGAPFMLSTAAFAVTGLAVLGYARSGRRPRSMRINTDILGRDMTYFLMVYTIAILATFLPHHGLKIGVAFLLLGFYAFYVYRTLSGEGQLEETPSRLYLAEAIRARTKNPPLSLSTLQFFIALGLMIGGAKVFVDNLETVSVELGVPALVLSLILAPLATELPEKFNSILWVRQRKDTLAMGNISGAMVFQSCIPAAVGLLFTPWDLTQPALVSAGIAIASTLVVYLLSADRAASMSNSGVLLFSLNAPIPTSTVGKAQGSREPARAGSPVLTNCRSLSANWRATSRWAPTNSTANSLSLINATRSVARARSLTSSAAARRVVRLARAV